MPKFSLTTAIAALALTAMIVPVMAQSTRIPGGSDNNRERPRGGYSQSEENCGNELGHLPRVFPEQVLAIDDHTRVWVTEICSGTNLGMSQSEGNGTYLRRAIAQNDVLVDVLNDRGWFADNVFAVRMLGDDTISLFVHDFHR